MEPLDFGVPPWSFAFQPIIDAHAGTIHSYESLIRGRNNESAGAILGQVPPHLLHQFDRVTRDAAIELAASLGIACDLNLNILPQSVHTSPGAIQGTVDTALRCGVSLDRIVLEVTEGEMIVDQERFIEVVNNFRGRGLKVAIDDFGAGYAGLNLLADFQPDMVKLDMNLVRSIESRGPRQAIVRAILQACGDLGIDVLAEGIETVPEYQWFRDEGVQYYQGYLFGRPAFERLDEYRGAGLE